MVKIEASVMIDRSVEDVWKYMTDWDNISKWDPGILETKQTSSGPLGLGTTLQMRSPNRWARVSKGRVVEYQSNRKFTLEFTSPRMIEGTMDSAIFESVEGKTKLTRVFDLKFSGFYKLLGPLVTRGAEREVGATVSNVKRILESEAKP